MYKKADASLTSRLGGPRFPVGTDAASAALTGVTAWKAMSPPSDYAETSLQRKEKLSSSSLHGDNEAPDEEVFFLLSAAVSTSALMMEASASQKWDE